MPDPSLREGMLDPNDRTNARRGYAMTALRQID
jgi:hypothetical protein